MHWPVFVALFHCIFLYINQANSTEGDLIQDSSTSEINILTLISVTQYKFVEGYFEIVIENATCQKLSWVEKYKNHGTGRNCTICCKMNQMVEFLLSLSSKNIMVWNKSSDLKNFFGLFRNIKQLSHIFLTHFLKDKHNLFSYGYFCHNIK